MAGRVAGTAEAVTVLDMSDGGFLIEAERPFSIATLHRFRVALPTGEWETYLTAAAVHGHQRTGPSGAPRFVTGFSFIQPRGIEAQARLMQLIDQTISVLEI